MKSFHTRLWMKWEPGDTISPRTSSLQAELLIFPSGAEMIFCPSFFFFTVNQCRTILSLCPHFLSHSEKLPSHEFKAGAQMRWALLARNYISAWLSHVSARNTSESEENIFMSWRWPYSAVKGWVSVTATPKFLWHLTCILVDCTLIWCSKDKSLQVIRDTFDLHNIKVFPLHIQH